MARWAFSTKLELWTLLNVAMFHPHGLHGRVLEDALGAVVAAVPGHLHPAERHGHVEPAVRIRRPHSRTGSSPRRVTRPRPPWRPWLPPPACPPWRARPAWPAHLRVHPGARGCVARPLRTRARRSALRAAAWSGSPVPAPSAKARRTSRPG